MNGKLTTDLFFEGYFRGTVRNESDNLYSIQGNRYLTLAASVTHEVDTRKAPC